MKKYHLAENIIEKSDVEALISWLKTNPRLTKNSLTVEFEKRWAKWVGTKYAVFCNSGSSANLLMAYSLLESGRLENNKVIVPSVGWVTTIAPFMQFGFEPIMCGADKLTFGLDLKQLEELFKKHHPAVVMIVQVLGVPGDMDKLLSLKRKYNFLLLEDACAALGAEYGKKKLGSFGDMSSFSFYFGHQLSTIEGGMINTDDEDFYHLLLMLRSHGWGKDLPKSVRKHLLKINRVDNFHEPFTFFVPGFNLRSTDLNAFLGLRMMEKADEIVARRNINHITYMRNIKNVTFQLGASKGSICSISFGALAKDESHRKRIVKVLDKHQIETRLFSAGNLGLHPFWIRDHGEFHHPVSDAIHYQGFFLPNNESMMIQDVEYICNIVNSIQ